MYPIPLRSLYSKNVGNLLLAGRNISASHVAFTSTRVMATCAVVGQAAGQAAVACLEKGLLPRQLASDKKAVHSLKQRLLRNDQSLRDTKNEDPEDLARVARVRASHEAAGKPASLVTNGWTRDIPENKKLGTSFVANAWEAPLKPGETWLELAWDAPKKISQVQFTFDSGFQRELTLSSSDAITRGIIRAAQPETVRDYRLLYRARGSEEWRELASVSGNWQRLRRHRFTAVEAAAVRLEVQATNGIGSARVFEVRCYA